MSRDLHTWRYPQLVFNHYFAICLWLHLPVSRVPCAATHSYRCTIEASYWTRRCFSGVMLLILGCTGVFWAVSHCLNHTRFILRKWYALYRISAFLLRPSIIQLVSSATWFNGRWTVIQPLCLISCKVGNYGLSLTLGRLFFTFNWILEGARSRLQHDFHGRFLYHSMFHSACRCYGLCSSCIQGT